MSFAPCPKLMMKNYSILQHYLPYRTCRIFLGINHLGTQCDLLVAACSPRLPYYCVKRVADKRFQSDLLQCNQSPNAIRLPLRHMHMCPRQDLSSKCVASATRIAWMVHNYEQFPPWRDCLGSRGGGRCSNLQKQIVFIWIKLTNVWDFKQIVGNPQWE